MEHRNRTLTIIIGFAAGLIISGVLGDAIDFAAAQARRVQQAARLRMGDALLAGGDAAGALRVYDAALRKVPGKDRKDFARLRYKEGLAFYSLMTSSDTVRCAPEALAAFRDALRVYEPLRFPRNYADTWNNIGSVYGLLAAHEDRAGNTARAAAAYTEALKVYTEKDYPREHRMVQENLRQVTGGERLSLLAPGS